MKVLVSGGGSGGHIYPALAVAAQLAKTYAADILYLGSDDGLETELAPAAGFAFAMIKAGKLQRYLAWSTVTGVGRVPVGMAQAVNIVRKFRPDVAFTSGGYVAVPTGLAARLNGVPLVMHQQDVPPNLSNRLIAPIATRISVAFADSKAYFPARKTLHLGNPVRQEILDVRSVLPQQARSHFGLAADLPLLLVTGGSQGARHLNQVVCSALPDLLPHCSVLQITGKKLFNESRTMAEQAMEGLNEEMRQRYKPVAYLNEEMPLALQAATLVLCRAGASTITELAVLGKAGILVPLPPAIGSSPQEANAEMFAKGGAASVIKDKDLKREIIVERVKSSISSQNEIEAMSEAAFAFAIPDATQRIAAEVARIANLRGAKVTRHESLVV